MEMKTGEYIRQSLDMYLPDLVTNPKLAKKMNLGNPVTVKRETARSAMTKFANKTADVKNGQFDSTSLRIILENCKIFAGWRKNQARGENGWLQARDLKRGFTFFTPKFSNPHSQHSNQFHKCEIILLDTIMLSELGNWKIIAFYQKI